MSFKEWTAVVQIAGVILIGGWVVLDAIGGGATQPLQAVAMKLVWTIGAVILFNIVAIIIVSILVSIAQRAELKDEKADERDRLFATLSSRNGYVVTSIAAALALVAVAFGAEPVIAIYALFAAPMLGGATDAVSQLVYYRIS
jgi:hypothetical protein